MIKKIALLTVFLCSVLFLHAQEKNVKIVDLSWNENQILRIDKNTAIRLPLITNQFVNDDLIPNFSTQWSVAENLKVLNYIIAKCSV